MTRTRAFFAIPLLAATVTLGACTTSVPNSTTVSPASVQRPAYVDYGTIASVRTVQIRNNDQVAGALVGGVVGGVLGNQFGRGRGNDVMTVLGAGTGAVVGSNLANNPQYAQEWTVRLNNGRSIAIIQSGQFYVGQPVQVVTAPNGSARITTR